LSAIQKLTPEADGKYYHTVHSGETLSWIAGWYGIPLTDLMAWNGLNAASVIRPEQKLLLLVTLPATATLTPSPATITPSPSPTMLQPSPTMTSAVAATRSKSRPGLPLILGVAVLVIGGLLWWRFSHRS